jgi:diketogulonate reductase-like aldo/keto reductase
MTHTNFFISSEGIQVPRLIYGTAWKKEATTALVQSALRQGFRGFDTACQPKHYDEAGVGAGIALVLGDDLTRQDLYLQSKFTPLSGQDLYTIPYDPAAELATQLQQSLQASLTNLQTEYLDCWVLHSPVHPWHRLLQAWHTMENSVDTGLVKQLGISNCYDHDLLVKLHQAARIKPAVVQNRFYQESGYDQEIRAFCRNQGIIYQSFWTLSANPHLLKYPDIINLAGKYAQQPAQILYRYLTQTGIAPLTGTKSVVHMRQDLAIFEFELEDQEIEGITDLLI